MKTTTKTKQSNKELIQVIISISILTGVIAYNILANGVTNNLINFAF
jgi:hypothetical protein